MTEMTYGIDVNSPVSASQWTCLTEAGARFVVARAYRNSYNGIPDPDCPANVAGAWAAGVEFVDVYHFPVINNKTPGGQAKEDLDYLAAHNVRFGRMWLDVEGNRTSGSWHADPQFNVQFIQSFVATVQAAGVVAGIYCGTEGWADITGNTTQLAAIPLWWSSHGKPFATFGGWTAPTLVQYAYDTSKCGLVYDSDYVYPG
jgi:hypothetical protein